jgi:hypothetical protein
MFATIGLDKDNVWHLLIASLIYISYSANISQFGCYAPLI